MSHAKSSSWKTEEAHKELEHHHHHKDIKETDFVPLSPKDNQENSFETPKKNLCKQRKKSFSNPSPLSERQQIALLLQLTAVPAVAAAADLQSPSIETRSSSKEKLNERGETALHIAAIRGDVARTKQLLEQGVQVDSTDFAGWTPLHEACNHGWLQVVELLIQAGANVNAKGFEETSPLHDAAANGHIKIVKLLLEHGAEPTQTNIHHQTPLQLTHSKAVTSLLQEALAASSTASSESPTHQDNKTEDTTMKKNTPSTPKSKGGEKGGSSSRLTIKLSQVKPSDSSAQGYTVSVESGSSNDVYEFSKEEEPEPANPSDGEAEEPRAAKRRKSTDKAPPVLTPVTAPKSKSPASTPSKQQQRGGSETDGEEPPHSPKVPPLKIVLPSSVEVETKERTLPYIVHSSEASPPEKEETEPPPMPAKSKEGSPEERFQRMTRSAHRAAAAQASSSSSSSSSENSAPSNNTNNNVSTTDGALGEEAAPELHPRKRKLRPRGESAAAASSSTTSTVPPEPPPLPPPLPPLSEEPQQIFNPYQMYQNIRKQLVKKRDQMYIVPPKPPQGFNDYLMNRCTYLLEGNKTEPPPATPPPSLPPLMRDFYLVQEKDRFKLRRQHQVERERLVLTREQEILRVHCRAARATVNQPVPLSVCTVIRDSEIYNVLEPPASEVTATEASRSRYNGRLFLSWLQDVTDKWDKIKEAMLLRHQNEAESLQAVQKLDWEWKLKEHGLCEPKSSPVIEELHVPMVQVNNDFELLPP